MPAKEYENSWIKGGIKYTLLHERYGGLLGDDSHVIGLHIYTYLMLGVSSVLFPTNSRNVVHLRYIRPLRRISGFVHFLGILQFWHTHTGS